MNKEIEELLNKFKNADSQQFNELVEDFDNVYKLLSYIEELEEEIERQSKLQVIQDDEITEANDSITWWQNRYNAIVKQNDDNHKKVVKLENNRDKAIEILESMPINASGGEILEVERKVLHKLKGDSE